MAATQTTSSPIVEDADALQSLEDRILRAVELVAQLRKDNEDLKTEITRLSGELETMQSERKQVRSRIEKLLGQMDTLAG